MVATRRAYSFTEALDALNRILKVQPGQPAIRDRLYAPVLRPPLRGPGACKSSRYRHEFLIASRDSEGFGSKTQGELAEDGKALRACAIAATGGRNLPERSPVTHKASRLVWRPKSMGFDPSGRIVQIVIVATLSPL